MPDLNDDHRWRLLLKKTHEQNLVSAFRVFRENGIEPIVIKGWAAGRCYPTDRIRHYTDIDLAVSPRDFTKASGLVRRGDGRSFNIDLHNGLRSLDVVEWDDLFANSIEIELDGETVRVLSDEDHLRVLAVHWLTDGGIFKERLWDIYYLINSLSSDFDWKRSLDIAGAKRKKWVILTIAVVRDHFGLNVENLPEEIGKAKIPRWMSDTLEREWKFENRLLPLSFGIRKPSLLIEQISRRLPPNPLASIVEVEGEIGEYLPIGCQIRCMFKRIGPGIYKMSQKFMKKDN